jgi:hypothetical protein
LTREYFACYYAGFFCYILCQTFISGKNMPTSSSPLSIAASRTLQVVSSGLSLGRLSLSGSGFGTRTAAYDSYTNYNDEVIGTGQVALGYSAVESSVQPTIQSNDAHDGGNSLQGFYPAIGSHFPKLRRNFTPVDQLYGAFHFKWTAPVNAGDVGIFKLFRAGQTNYTGFPRAVETIRSAGNGIQDGSDTGVFRDDAGNSYLIVGNSNSLKDANEWHFCEYFFKLSAPGVADGAWAGWTNGQVSFSNFAAVTRFQAGSKIDFFINMFDGRDRDAFDMTVYQSEEYVSSSQARVVITNTATYANSTIWQIQPIVSWADSQIVIEKTRGALPLGTHYAHIFNEAGQAVSSQAVVFN